MSRSERWLRETAFLKTHVFYGLHNLNDGFDVADMKYFSETEFMIVLERCKTMGILVESIEPWKDRRPFREFYSADVLKGADDPEWYFDAFLELVAMDENLLYAASFNVPIRLLELEHYPSNPYYIFLNTFREDKRQEGT